MKIRLGEKKMCEADRRGNGKNGFAKVMFLGFKHNLEEAKKPPTDQRAYCKVSDEGAQGWTE